MIFVWFFKWKFKDASLGRPSASLAPLEILLKPGLIYRWSYRSGRAMRPRHPLEFVWRLHEGSRLLQVRKNIALKILHHALSNSSKYERFFSGLLLAKKIPWFIAPRCSPFARPFCIAAQDGNSLQFYYNFQSSMQVLNFLGLKVQLWHFLK